jgi:serine/threonine-protein kinase
MLAANKQGGVVDRNADPLVGAELDGRYRILRVIGEGGMGIVYEGEHVLIERRVAIKVLREDFCKRADVVERFRREAKSASRIGHPNIVDVLDFGETPGGASYFVMEMLHGEDLADVLAKQGALPPERAALIVYQCCHALAAAHDKGIVHRDLKPENIFLINRAGSPDFVKVVDFGVAKMSEQEISSPRRLTRSGMIFGTPEYMSPEQAAGHAPDHRVDVYALGVTLYELLTGRVPFQGESFMSVLGKHARKQVPALRDVNPRVQVSPQLENAVFRALRKDRRLRYQHMREMAAALEKSPEMPRLPFRMSLPPLREHGPISETRTLREDSAPTLVPAQQDLVASEAGGLRMSRAVAARLGIGAALLLCAAAVYTAIGGASAAPVRLADVASRPSAAAPATAAGIAPAPPGETAPAALPAGVVGEQEEGGLELVTVRVTTRPAGASVRLSGGDEVCASTPCAFEVVRSKPISLQARRGARSAVATLSPAGTTDLHLVLAGGGGAPAVRRPADELKVPEIFRAPAK